MIALGVFHIILSLIAYIAYFYVTMKTFEGETPQRILLLTNLLYLIGLGTGLIWAKIEWGFYINWDIKNIISVLLPIPFIAAERTRENTKTFTALGSSLILLNYILPMIIDTIHIH